MGSLPLDIADLLVEIVAEEDDPNLSTTKACSLVCHDLLALCRKRIFARIVLNDISYNIPKTKYGWQQHMTTSRLHQLLSISPNFASYIRDLDYCIVDEDKSEISLVNEVFNYITKLNTLTIRKQGISNSFSWINSDLRPALVRLLHLPMLVNLNMKRVGHFAFRDLVNSHIAKLGIFTIGIPDSLASSDVQDSSIKLRSLLVGSFSSYAISHICHAKCTDETPIIDFDSLEELSIYLINPQYAKNVFHLISRCKRLNSLRIIYEDFWTPEYTSLSGLSQSVHPSAMQTLKQLEIHISYDEENNEDQFCCIPNELEQMADRNIIEQVTIKVFLQRISGQRELQWSRFDAAFGSGWPNLRRVTLVTVLGGKAPAGGLIEGVLCHVQDTQFPTLSSRKSSAFELVIQNDNNYYGPMMGG